MVLSDSNLSHAKGIEQPTKPKLCWESELVYAGKHQISACPTWGLY
jgi:hypothetical protein